MKTQWMCIGIMALMGACTSDQETPKPLTEAHPIILKKAEKVEGAGSRNAQPCRREQLARAGDGAPH